MEEAEYQDVPVHAQSDSDMQDADIRELSHADKGARAIPETDRQRMTSDTVRMALFAEWRGISLKRDDLKKMLCKDHLGNRTCSFFRLTEATVKPEYSKTIPFAIKKANEILQDTFGMEMCQLPARKEDGPAASSATATNSYILRNTLPLEHVQRVVIHSEKKEKELGFITLVLSLIFVHRDRMPLSTFFHR
jgi:hypothetical protein